MPTVILCLWLKRVKLFQHLRIFDARKYATEPVLKQSQSLTVRTEQAVYHAKWRRFLHQRKQELQDRYVKSDTSN